MHVVHVEMKKDWNNCTVVDIWHRAEQITRIK
jgi:hypothetical protein